MSLTIEQQEDGRTTRLRLAGELDTDTAPRLRPVIEELAQRDMDVLVLELKDLEYISSAGLRCIFQMKKLMTERGGRFAVSQPSAQVRKVFAIVKAVPVRSVFDSEAELDAYLDRMQRKIAAEQRSG